jgi:formylglycine-generating enzyme required for sulfatase activity
MLPDNRIPQIHQFLKDFVSNDELTEICYINFRAVHRQFADGMALGPKILRLLDYCERQGQIDELLHVLEKNYPKRYEERLAALALTPVVPKPKYNPPNIPEPTPSAVSLGLKTAAESGSGLPDFRQFIITIRNTSRPVHLAIPGVLLVVALYLWGAASFWPDTTQIRLADGMVMVYAPPGTFMMGRDSSGSDEFPAHQVTLTEGFWIDQTEVTNEQYGQCVAEGNCAVSLHANDSSWNEPNHPVVGVSWHDAVDYCTWAGGQLPTEAQWEYAARGPDNLVYPWGDAFDGEKTNFCDTNCSFDWKESDWDDGYATTAPVGRYLDGRSWVGAVDVVGNVWEWVADWYDSNYYEMSSAENPTGPDDGDYKVLRGGSWYHNAVNVRADLRHNAVPDFRFSDIGFRCTAGPGV